MRDLRRRGWIVLGIAESVTLIGGVAAFGWGAGVVLALFSVGLFGSVLSWILAEGRR